MEKLRQKFVVSGVLSIPIIFGIIQVLNQSPRSSIPLPTQPFSDGTDGVGGSGGGGESGTIAFEGNEWSCAKVNNPLWSSYNPSLPTVINAFRAVGLAGTPNVWESGPYLHIDNGGGKKLGASWDAFGETYNGEQVCVQTRIQSRLPQRRVVFRQDQFRRG